MIVLYKYFARVHFITHYYYITAVETLASHNENESQELGGLFRIAREENKERQTQLSVINLTDCSKFVVTRVQNWSLPEVSFDACNAQFVRRILKMLTFLDSR